MKKSILFLLVLFVSASSYAQKKPKINKAESAWRAGEYAEALDIVNRGAKHEKTKDDPKTWFMRGLVYMTIDTSSDKSVQNLANNPLETAIESFNKATDLTGGKKEEFIAGPNGLPVLQSQIITSYWGYNFNQGVAEFQNDDAEKAYNYFINGSKIIPDSVVLNYYAGLAAMQQEKYDDAVMNFDKYIQNDGPEEDAYAKAIYIYSNMKKDNEKAYEIVKKAKKMFPKSKTIAQNEVQVLYAMDKLDEAIAGLRESIANDPENPSHYFTLGVLLEQTEDTDGALKAYNEGLEIDPENFDLNFNIAAIYANTIVDLAKEKNELGISSEDQKKAEEIDEKIQENAKTALPKWEKVNELKPDQQQTLNTLQYLYYQVKDYDKAEAVANRIKELGFDQ